ncbi:MAG: hypothetical protein HKO62_01600 [Gammaproteobacteria bacterium]|nr:hypothetical protein [Gammaproteobacteria bacterium]
MFLSRRSLLEGVLLAPLIPLSGSKPARAADDFPATITALREGYEAETAAYRRYALFGRLAGEDGYRGVAYLHTALASSEQIHAENYIRVLNGMGVSPQAPAETEIPIGTTKDNLIHAAERELNSINNTYPAILEQMKEEAHPEAMKIVEYSWASHKQHLDIINKIRRWSPRHFETVARKIDKKTDRYFVCGICGSTITKVPTDDCPVCKEAPGSYRLISPEDFSG